MTKIHNLVPLVFLGLFTASQAWGQLPESTAALSIIDGEEASGRSAKNIGNGILGHGLGIVSIQSVGRYAAQNPTFYVRGLQTLNGNNAPLILVDGIDALIRLFKQILRDALMCLHPIPRAPRNRIAQLLHRFAKRLEVRMIGHCCSLSDKVACRMAYDDRRSCATNYRSLIRSWPAGRFRRSCATLNRLAIGQPSRNLRFRPSW